MNELTTLAECSALMRERRSLKPVDMDLERSIVKALVQELLTNATWAPTHGLTQPWRFHIFSGSARQRLATCLQSLYQTRTPAAEFKEEKYVKLGQNPLLAPLIIACSMRRDPTQKIAEAEEIEAVACAIQNVLLSATAAGLGSFWSTPPVIGLSAFADWLGLGAGDRCCGLVYLGYAQPGRSPKAPPRCPAEALTTWAT